jgi:hypothetical protein
MDSLLYIGSAVRLLTGIFFFLAAWELYKRNAEASVAALAMAAHQLGLVLANVPLLFSLEITQEYVLFHSVLMLLVSHLRLVAIAFLPLAWSGKGLDRWVSKRRTWLGVVMASFIGLTISVMILKSLPNAASNEVLQEGLRLVDALVNWVSLVVFSWYAWRLLKSRLGKNALSAFIGLLLGACLLVVFYFSLMWYVAFQIPPQLFITVASTLVLLVFSATSLLVFSMILTEGNSESVPALSSGWLNASGEIGRLEGLELHWTPQSFQFHLDVWMDNGERKRLTIEKDRLTKPGAHWLAFALATVHNIDLVHGDMNVVKFRMVDWWNKSASSSMQQKILFQGNRGAYRLALPPQKIKVHIQEDVLEFDVIKEAMADFGISWLQAEPIQALGLKKADLVNNRSQWIAQLLKGI